MKNRKYICKCGRSYTEKGNLARHVKCCKGKTKVVPGYTEKEVSGVAIFECKKCHSQYTTKRAFNLHISHETCHKNRKPHLIGVKKVSPEETKEGKQDTKTVVVEAAENTGNVVAEMLVSSRIAVTDGQTPIQELKKLSEVTYPDVVSQSQLDSDDTETVFSWIVQRKSAFAISMELMERRLTEKLNEILSVVSRNKHMFEILPSHMLPIKRGVYEKLPEVVPDILREKEADFLCRQQNEKTRSNYARILNRFCQSIKDTPTYDDYKTFFDQHDKGTAAKTIDTEKAVISSFLKGEFGWGELGTKVNLSAFAPPKSWYAPSRTAVGAFMRGCCLFGHNNFGVFVWFAYATGQRLSDLLTARSEQLLKDESGNTLLTIIASKTGKSVTKLLPASLVPLLAKSGTLFDLGGKRKVQEMFVWVSQKMSPGKPIKAKNLRAGHISAIGSLVKAAMDAGNHSNSQVTQSSYLNPAVLNMFDMKEYYFS
jgi:integrase